LSVLPLYNSRLARFSLCVLFEDHIFVNSRLPLGVKHALGVEAVVAVAAEVVALGLDALSGRKDLGDEGVVVAYARGEVGVWSAGGGGVRQGEGKAGEQGKEVIALGLHALGGGKGLGDEGGVVACRSGGGEGKDQQGLSGVKSKEREATASIGRNRARGKGRRALK
jgi:hypothetical protein